MDCREWGAKEMSLPERIHKDLALSEQVMQRLDGLTEVPKDITALVLNAYGTTEFKLDLRITYLRRVHHFCFYAARWCDDEWSLARCLRPRHLACAGAAGVHAGRVVRGSRAATGELPGQRASWLPREDTCQF